MTQSFPLTVEQAPTSFAERLQAAITRRLRWAAAYLRCRQLRKIGTSIDLGARGIWKLRPGASLTVGRSVSIRDDYDFYVQGELRIGADVFMNRNFQLACFSRIDIGDSVRFGERVSVHDENHVVEPVPIKSGARNTYVARPITIENDVWIGANTVVLGGSVIGQGTVIGANSVVRGVIPAFVIAAGSPAVVIRSLRARD
jgi:acetyltransferase-like isoleucine patch superfamily enzyme